MIKKFTLLVLIPFFFVFSKSVFAADLTVTCTLNSCSDFGGGKFCSMQPYSNAPLFNVDNILPGESATRIIKVSNTGSCDCGEINLKTSNVTYGRKTLFEIFSPMPTDISTKFFTVIKSGTTDFYGLRSGVSTASNNKTLDDLFGESVISLGSLSSGVFRDYEWVVTFDPQTGNEYQGVITNFDFDMEFKCGSGGGDGDGDGNGEGNGSNENDGDEITDEVIAGAATEFAYGGFAGLFQEVAGAVNPEIANPEIDEVGGVQDGTVGGVSTCIDPKFWWVLFIVQFLICFLLYKRVNKQNIYKKKQHYLLQILVDLIFMFIFWKYFCPWWDVLVSALIGVFWILFLKRKIHQLTKPKP